VPEIPWVNMLIGPRMVEMAAFIVLGLWIVFQLISGVGTVACTDESADTGGIAYMAHIGGFVAGLSMALLGRPLRSPSNTASAGDQRHHAHAAFGGALARLSASLLVAQLSPDPSLVLSARASAPSGWQAFCQISDCGCQRPPTGRNIRLRG
jgi:hypothetical protein